jgi:hypothetical protein
MTEERETKPIPRAAMHNIVMVGLMLVVAALVGLAAGIHAGTNIGKDELLREQACHKAGGKIWANKCVLLVDAGR